MIRFFIVLFLCGCSIGTVRTIYVPAGKSVKLRQDVRGVKIWAHDVNGALVAGKANLEEGWYVLPDTKAEK